MSANNYMLIHKVKGRWYVCDNLNAEEAMTNDPLCLSDAMVFETLEKAIAWANENDETEYGYQINNLRKPKDGFKEELSLPPQQEGEK